MNLPKEIWTIIFLKCRIIDLLSLQLSCKMFNQIICGKFFETNYVSTNTENLEDYFHECRMNFKVGDIILIPSYSMKMNPHMNDIWPMKVFSKNIGANWCVPGNRQGFLQIDGKFSYINRTWRNIRFDVNWLPKILILNKIEV